MKKHPDQMLRLGSRVFVTGTKHHGFRGAITARPPDWPWRKAWPVLLDEWDEPLPFYTVNLIALQ